MIRRQIICLKRSALKLSFRSEKEDSGYGTEDFQLVADCLKEYMVGFQERNRNFYVFNAVLHMDEATPHLHIDYISVGHYKRGQDTQNGIAQALKEMGYGKGKQAIARWRAAEVEVLNKICLEHGIQPLATEKARGTLEIPEYKEKRRQADELAEQNAQVEAELSKKVEQINRALKYLPDLQKNEKAEHEFLVAVSELHDMLKSGMSILRNKDSIISRIDTLESLTKKAMDKRDKADLTIYDLRQRGEEVTAELDDALDKLKAVRSEKSQLSSELQTVRAENREYAEICAMLERIAPDILRQAKALVQEEKEQRQREQTQQVEHQPTPKKDRGDWNNNTQESRGSTCYEENNMNNKTLQEMNDAYKDCPVRTSEYTIDGKKYIVKSHFVGAKKLDDVLYRIAFEQAMGEALKTA